MYRKDNTAVLALGFAFFAVSRTYPHGFSHWSWVIAADLIWLTILLDGFFDWRAKRKYRKRDD